MTIVFIAVQCFQCSMMQVKQQKKSSNKWTCVVCNEKQSLRKVFARGYQAKDIRKFVQGFNMAKQIADDDDDDEEQTLISPPEEETLISLPEDEITVDFMNYDNNNNSSSSKRRTDWNEYLDRDEFEGGFDDEGKGDDEPVVVTELPKELFKKPRLDNYSTGPIKPGGKKLYSPTFEKRKPNNKPRNSQAKQNHSLGLNKPEGKKLYSPTFGKRKSDNNNTQSTSRGDTGYKVADKCQETMGQGLSKWIDYLAEDEDYLSFGNEDLIDAHSGAWNHGISETSFKDQSVEEEVHPDFC